MTFESLTLDPVTVQKLSGVTTATLTTVLLKKGLRNVWIRGAKPLNPGQARVVGPAFTLRFVPAREDLATSASWGAPISTRAAVEAMPAGCIAVADAMGLTDGVIRDMDGVVGTGLPVWYQGAVLPGLYPPNEANKSRYEAWAKNQR